MTIRSTFRVRWTSRLLGLCVLALAVAGIVLLVREGGRPWSWAIVGSIAVLSALATLANFRERLEADDEGLTFRTGTGASRRAAWSAIARATDQDGDTWFLEVDGQRRWVLDHLDGHEQLGLLLRDRGISVDVRRAPRPWRLGRGDRPGAT